MFEGNGWKGVELEGRSKEGNEGESEGWMEERKEEWRKELGKKGGKEARWEGRTAGRKEGRRKGRNPTIHVSCSFVEIISRADQE